MFGSKSIATSQRRMLLFFAFVRAEDPATESDLFGISQTRSSSLSRAFYTKLAQIGESKVWVRSSCAV